MKNIRELLSRKQVAERLGYQSTISIRRLEQSGKLKGIWLNSRVVRYREEDLEELINTGANR
tara:strand:- start:256 stop:441 length:186 start_codon:yes stop_codon:yes gene_type:complete